MVVLTHPTGAWLRDRSSGKSVNVGLGLDSSKVKRTLGTFRQISFFVRIDKLLSPLCSALTSRVKWASPVPTTLNNTSGTSSFSHL